MYGEDFEHHVTGIDKNQASLEAIQEIAQKEGLSKVATQLHDLNQPLALGVEHFDFVLSIVTL